LSLIWPYLDRVTFSDSGFNIKLNDYDPINAEYVPNMFSIL